MTKPLISIIMPAFNAERFIAQSIDTVISQTYTNWELIIINDGSTDETEAIAKQYTAVDTRVKLINQENRKLSAARNTGIEAASGDWVAFLDADDLWVADKLEKQVNVINTHADIGLVFSDGFIFNNHDPNTRLPYGSIPGPFTGAAMYNLLYQGNYIPILSVLVKKHHLDDIGAQDEQFVACQDWDYWLRLTVNGVRFYGMADKLFYYRRHDSNMSNNDDLMELEKAMVYIKNFKPELFDDQGLQNLKTFIKITICKLIAKEKIKEAIYLSSAKNQIFRKGVRTAVSFMVSFFKSKAYYPVRLMFKAETLLVR